MDMYKSSLVIPIAVLVIMGGTFGLFLLSKTTDVKKPLLTEQVTLQATTSESLPAQVEELLPATPTFVNNWTQKDGADFTEVTISDLRPYTNKSLELKLSVWSGEEGNPSSSNGEILFNRDSGELVFDPTEPPFEVSEGVGRSGNVLLQIYHIEPGLSRDALLKKIVIADSKSFGKKYNTDLKETEAYIHKFESYCVAKQFEGSDYYVFVENDEYSKLPKDEEDYFGPCPFGATYHFYDDFVMKRISKQRQIGVSVDDVILR